MSIEVGNRIKNIRLKAYESMSEISEQKKLIELIHRKRNEKETERITPPVEIF